MSLNLLVTNQQLYIAVGIPLLFNAVLIGLVMAYINAGFQALEAKFEGRFQALEARMSALDVRMTALAQAFTERI